MMVTGEVRLHTVKLKIVKPPPASSCRPRVMSASQALEVGEGTAVWDLEPPPSGFYDPTKPRGFPS